MIFLRKIKEYKKNKNGFTLLFAVLVAVLILSVGITIINLSIKQIIISGSARESQYAFYAANTGLECAKYWDIKSFIMFPGGEVVFKYIQSEQYPNDTDNITCNNVKLFNTSSLDGNLVFDPDKKINSFTLRFDGYPYCAYVEVLKYPDTNNNYQIKTIIDSYGYNTCDESNPRRIERGLREVI
ncbi:MAG TPA: pilus assembly PilX N-terminal domain-containing protein [Candidatus Paceibacterota bacterium]|nr:pilus assembly PilX N-terminal domain-containing protein [Candidatus Paceibacterota bacterium]HMP85209.1 pilus assembly PilX N-terminal domain-containing protein [Candidatus Paceibacterota bacterium]